MPAQDGGRCHQPLLAQPTGESAHQRGEHRTIGPLPAAGGEWSGAARRSRVAAPAVRRPWPRRTGREARATRRVERRSGKAVVTPCPGIMPPLGMVHDSAAHPPDAEFWHPTGSLRRYVPVPLPVFTVTVHGGTRQRMPCRNKVESMTIARAGPLRLPSGRVRIPGGKSVHSISTFRNGR